MASLLGAPSNTFPSTTLYADVIRGKSSSSQKPDQFTLQLTNPLGVVPGSAISLSGSLTLDGAIDINGTNDQVTLEVWPWIADTAGQQCPEAYSDPHLFPIDTPRGSLDETTSFLPVSILNRISAWWVGYGTNQTYYFAFTPTNEVNASINYGFTQGAQMTMKRTGIHTSFTKFCKEPK